MTTISSTSSWVTANSSAADTPWWPGVVSYGGTRVATLRTTNISPGRASKMIAGSTRLSEQAITMHLGALALGEFRPALLVPASIRCGESGDILQAGRRIASWPRASRSGAGVASGGPNRYLAAHERPRTGTSSAQARLDPRQGADQPGLSLDAHADARPRPCDRVRRSGLPEHRRVLDQEARDGDDPRRHVHARLRLLQCEDGHAARRGSAGAGACRDRGRRARPRAYRGDLGRPRRSAGRRRVAVREGHRGARRNGRRTRRSRS